METPLQPRVETKAHDWLKLAAGRICKTCLLVQVMGDYEESQCSE